MYTEKKRAEENYPLNDLIVCDDNKTVMTSIYSEHSMSQTLPEALSLYINSIKPFTSSIPILQQKKLNQLT